MACCRGAGFQRSRDLRRNTATRPGCFLPRPRRPKQRTATVADRFTAIWRVGSVAHSRQARVRPCHHATRRDRADHALEKHGRTSGGKDAGDRKQEPSLASRADTPTQRALRAVHNRQHVRQPNSRRLPVLDRSNARSLAGPLRYYARSASCRHGVCSGSKKHSVPVGHDWLRGGAFQRRYTRQIGARERAHATPGRVVSHRRLRYPQQGRPPRHRPNSLVHVMCPAIFRNSRPLETKRPTISG